MAWKYQRQERQFPLIPEGNYRIRVASAEMVKSKAGRDMISLKFDVSGRNEQLFHYIVFLEDKPEITNRNLTNFYDSFKDIPDGSTKLQDWIGKVGACRIKHEESDYNGGTTQAKVHYFIKASKQGDLPAWQEPKSATVSANPEPNYGYTTDADGFINIPEGSGDLTEVPFF